MLASAGIFPPPHGSAATSAGVEHTQRTVSSTVTDDLLPNAPIQIVHPIALGGGAKIDS